jgi:hypothetical protein
VGELVRPKSRIIRAVQAKSDSVSCCKATGVKRQKIHALGKLVNAFGELEVESEERSESESEEEEDRKVIALS